jgi:hypothetical protein
LIGKAILFTLFAVGLIHLIRRISDGLERYTYSSLNMHESILHDMEPDSRPYSRFTAISFLIIGLGVSLGVGMVVGNFLELMNKAMMPSVYSVTLHPEFLFYPPIVVLIVDVMHAIFSRLEH